MTQPVAVFIAALLVALAVVIWLWRAERRAGLQNTDGMDVLIERATQANAERATAMETCRALEYTVQKLQAAQHASEARETHCAELLASAVADNARWMEEFANADRARVAAEQKLADRERGWTEAFATLRAGHAEEMAPFKRARGQSGRFVGRGEAA